MAMGGLSSLDATLIARQHDSYRRDKPTESVRRDPQICSVSPWSCLSRARVNRNAAERLDVVLHWLQENIPALSQQPEVIIGLGMVVVGSVSLYVITKYNECLVCCSVALAYAIPLMMTASR